MKTPSRLLWCLLFGFLCPQFAGAEDPKPADAPVVPAALPAHRWEKISYPAMTPWRKVMIRPSITVENKGKEGMALTLEYWLPWQLWQEKYGKVKPEAVTAELYRGSEKPVKLKGTFSSQPYEGSGPAIELRNYVTDHVFIIPWGPNNFDEAWVLLSLKDRNFWVELPYGFTRDPEAPFGPPDEKRGEPVFPALKRKPRGNDLVIHWEHVSYPLEPFRGGAAGTLKLSNPFDTISELGLGGFEGDVREPQAGVKFVFGPGNESDGHCFALKLERDRWRSQMFLYGRAPYDDRQWCRVEVSAGEEKRTLTVPSSLLFMCHGHAEIPEKVPQLKTGEKWNPDF